MRKLGVGISIEEEILEFFSLMAFKTMTMSLVLIDPAMFCIHPFSDLIKASYHIMFFVIS